MGKYNSSLYRIEPLIDYINTNDNLIIQFYELLGVHNLKLPEMICYGKNEKPLKPSKEHLDKLILYIGNKNCSSIPTKNSMRKQLYSAEETTRQEAINQALYMLDKHYDDLTPNSNPWYVFEGFTYPDVYIEGEDYIIVIEAKWTEPHITEKTTNLNDRNEYRNQMIRHIQAAINSSNKKVYAFYLVDKNFKDIDCLGANRISEYINKETIAITEPMKSKIITAYMGYKTWQDIERIFPNLKFLDKSQI